jgi:hypothetical protein
MVDSLQVPQEVSCRRAPRVTELDVTLRLANLLFAELLQDLILHLLIEVQHNTYFFVFFFLYDDLCQCLNGYLPLALAELDRLVRLLLIERAFAVE